MAKSNNNRKSALELQFKRLANCDISLDEATVALGMLWRQCRRHGDEVIPFDRVVAALANYIETTEIEV